MIMKDFEVQLQILNILLKVIPYLVWVNCKTSLDPTNKVFLTQVTLSHHNFQTCVKMKKNHNWKKNIYDDLLRIIIIQFTFFINKVLNIFFTPISNLHWILSLVFIIYLISSIICIINKLGYFWKYIIIVLIIKEI